MRRVAITLIVLGTLSWLAGGFAGAQEKKKPDATLELSEGSVAVGVGWSWGKGTLTYKGKKYPVKVDGLSVGEIGVTRATARGSVFDLKKLDDFNGTYTAGGAGATIGGGAGAAIMRNQNGVVIEMTSTHAGGQPEAGRLRAAAFPREVARRPAGARAATRSGGRTPPGGCCSATWNCTPVSWSCRGS
jgi:hypothetical protein